MFVLSVLEAPNTKTNSLCVQTHLAIKLFLILSWISHVERYLWFACLNRSLVRSHDALVPALEANWLPRDLLGFGTELKHQ